MLFHDRLRPPFQTNLVACPTLIAKAPQKVFSLGLFIKIYKTRNIKAIGPAAFVVFVQMAIYFCSGTQLVVVVHDISAQLIVVVAHAVGKGFGLGLPQYSHRSHGRGTEENNFSFKLQFLMGFRINNLDTRGLFG